MDKEKLESLISAEVAKYLAKDTMTTSELADSLANAVMNAYKEDVKSISDYANTIRDAGCTCVVIDPHGRPYDTKSYEWLVNHRQNTTCVAQLEVSDKVFEAIHEMTNKALEMRENALKKRTENILNSLINMLKLRVAVDEENKFPLISREAVLYAITGIGEVFGIQIKTVGK